MKNNSWQFSGVLIASHWDCLGTAQEEIAKQCTDPQVDLSSASHGISTGSNVCQSCRCLDSVEQGEEFCIHPFLIPKSEFYLFDTFLLFD